MNKVLTPWRSILAVFLAAAFFGFTPSLGRAQDATSPLCEQQPSGTEICKFAVPIQEKTREYQYEIRRAHPDQPTIIAIPGGPGQGLIGSLRMVIAGDYIPDDYGIILIDPRGVGKNDFGPDPSGLVYSTRQVVDDIFSIIRAEKLENYFIHGQSYGTVVTTVLASRLSQSHLPRPKGIVLSGVVSTFFENPLLGYNQQLKRLFSMYTRPEQDSIKQSLNILKEDFGDNEKVFANLFIYLLTPNTEHRSSDGRNSINMKSFFDILAKGSFDASNQAMQFFEETARTVGKKKLPQSIERKNLMPEVIKCRELTRNDEMYDLKFNFEKFEIISNVSDCTIKGYKLDRPYFSHSYQVEGIPLFYIQGLIDPATPMSGAKRHYDSQKNQDKIFVQVTQYAHTGLTGLWPCQKDLWAAFSGGPSLFKRHMEICRAEGIEILE